MTVHVLADDLLLTYPAPSAPVASGRVFTALDIGHLEVAAGRSLAVIGPPGSGKTSLLYALSGLEPLRRGRVTVGAAEVNRLGDGVRDDWRRRTVGLVFQDVHLFPGLDALGNVLLPATFDGLGASPRLRRRGLGLLERVGVGDGSRLVETLSRGDMQRVAMARALLFQPPLLLADEPTAGLDGAAARAVSELLLDLHREIGCTLIVATRDPWLAERLDGVCRLEGGRVVAEHATASAPHQ